MGPAERAGAEADAVAGRVPRLVFSPGSTAEAAEVLLRAAREHLTLAPVGGGTALGLGAPPASLDAVVRTERLSRILEYAPADMVVVAEAGVTLAALQATAAAHGQRLALDPPHPDRATVGGLVAVGASGPGRTRHGTVRDLIIGLTLVRADGAVARSGGKVVKNVAGFDLPKVACGSLGTLGLVATANFRLHPLPEASATACLAALSAAQVPAVLGGVREAQLEPAAAYALSTGPGRYEVAVVFEGFAAGVEQQLGALAELARAAGLDCARLPGQEAAALRARHDRIREAEGVRVRVSTLPSQLVVVDGLLAPLLGALEGGAFTWYPTVGLGWLGGEAADVPALAAALATARAALVAGGGALVLEAAPGGVRDTVDAWGPVPSAFHVMERLKRAFDPEGRLNPGRFVGGL
jgi:glycolate oxidase FAD binding subunit